MDDAEDHYCPLLAHSSTAPLMKTSLRHMHFIPYATTVHYSDLGLTQRVHTRFARDRSVLGWAAGAGGGGILRHGRAWF